MGNKEKKIINKKDNNNKNKKNKLMIIKNIKWYGRVPFH